MEDMEIWNLYNHNGKLIRTIRKGMRVPPGLYHPTVEVIPTDGKGRVLVSQRALQKRDGGCYEFPAGSVMAKESTAAAAVREMQEETGIQTSQISKMYLAHSEYQEADKPWLTGGVMRHLYIAVIPELQSLEITLDESEVMSYQIVTFDRWLTQFLPQFPQKRKLTYLEPELISKIRNICGTPEPTPETAKASKLVTMATLPTRKQVFLEEHHEGDN